jgi:hypothetical protein
MTKEKDKVNADQRELTNAYKSMITYFDIAQRAVSAPSEDNDSNAIRLCKPMELCKMNNKLRVLINTNDARSLLLND